ncbi:MAG: septum formation initiator family protein [Alistipes sp.]
MQIKIGKRFWILLTIVVSIFTAIVVGRNLKHIFHVKRALSALNQDADKYRASIKKDSTLLEELRYDDYLEQYAREHYHMQRAGEKVYIIK